LATGREAIKWGIGAIIVGISSYIIDAYLFRRGTAWPLTNSFFLASLFYSIFIKRMNPEDPSSRIVLAVSGPIVFGSAISLMLLLKRTYNADPWFILFSFSVTMLPYAVAILAYTMKRIKVEQDSQ
jgi:hypothetical protein